EWSTGATSESITADTTGYGPGNVTFWVRVTTAGGCLTSDTIHIDFTWPAGVPEPDDDLLKAYPNPAENVLEIDFTGTEPGKLMLINVHGETVLEQEIAPGHEDLDVSSFKSGLYMLELTVTGKRSTRKIILR
ncbi:MAG: T9SS type A sorting domain-containing protein, partial [Syntrophothermus sp.]